MSGVQTTTVGGYLATRLEQIGLKDYFAVPGDYNLSLLDELLKHKKMRQIGCCNELNAGYAADGYARSAGVAAVFVTFSVGGLSTINAAAGAYAEDLPVIFVSGSPNTNSEIENQVLHHTTGMPQYDYVRNMFSFVTAASVLVNNKYDAPYIIDNTIELCLRKKKPVYIEIPCNLACSELKTPPSKHFDISMSSNKTTLKEAVAHAASKLNKARKPVLVGGGKLRSADAVEAFGKLARKSAYPYAAMPNAKGMVDETDHAFMGIYWGPVSDYAVAEIVESADVYLFAGPVFSDYTTTGYSNMISKKKLIEAGPDKVTIDGQVYSGVFMKDFLSALISKVEKNETALKAYERIHGEVVGKVNWDPEAPLSREQLVMTVQDMLGPKSVVIAETGDSWFNGMSLRLPKGAGFEIQMQYGSIGWSVGATLGYAAASQGGRRVIALIGDGSFQMTVQELSTMIRYGVDPVIFLFNNRGYTIEVEIHDGPYNNIQNWDYSGLAEVFSRVGEGNVFTAKVETEKQLVEAVGKAKSFRKGPSFIEVVLDRDDCSHNLLDWGNRVATNNGRPPIETVWT